MTTEDWKGVISRLSHCGVSLVQFIGGEPTLRSDLPALIDHALRVGLGAEIYTNLVHVPAELWEVFAQSGVRLATSWYSDDPEEHAAITRRPSQVRTKASIAEAVRRSIPIRVGIVGVLAAQRVEQARAELAAIGVADVGYDRLRRVGRGGVWAPDASELCGQCADGNAAIGPDGSVWPCVFARWMIIGNVRSEPVAELLAAPLRRARDQLRTEFGAFNRTCVPDMCNPQCGPSCSPACRPASNCRPVGACAPWYR